MTQQDDALQWTQYLLNVQRVGFDIQHTHETRWRKIAIQLRKGLNVLGQAYHLTLFNDAEDFVVLGKEKEWKKNMMMISKRLVLLGNIITNISLVGITWNNPTHRSAGFEPVPF
jgi:hypothetical protein